MNIKHLFLFSIATLMISCSSNKCSENSIQVKEKVMGQGSRVALYRGTEDVVSIRNDTEVVKGFDSCTPKQTTYLYQRLRVSKDSTVLNGFFKIFYPNGKIKTLLHYNRGKQNGRCTDYWPDGTVRAITYMYNGMFSGPQAKYNSNGKLEEVSFLVNDSQYWFLVEYNKFGVIDSMSGRPFRIYSKINKEAHVGNEFKHIIEVPSLKDVSVSLNIQLLHNNYHILDTTISDFYAAYNTKFTRLEYVFTKKSKGKNEFIGFVKLTDSTNHKLIKKDSFDRVI